MSRLSIVLTVLITSLVMTLSGVVASPIASASENGNGSISATFPLGSSVLSNAQKAAIKKALASSGADVSFIVTGTAGKLPGVPDRWVQRLAKKRAQAIKAYLVSLGVSKANVTTQTKTTEIGIVPKSTGSYPSSAPTPTPTAVATNNAPATPTLTCATGGTCIVGDRGPGGGIVFYVSAANFTSAGSTCGTACKYLEVAPATWQDTTAPINTDVSNDLIYQWSNNTTVATVQDRTTASTEGIVVNRADEKVNWKIGQGFNNTSVMIVSSGATPPVLSLSAAQAAVLAYAGNSTAGQWFIPSMNELNELCKYARGQTTGVLTVACVTGTGIFKSTANAGTDLGGFVDYNYWSSSEFVASSTRLQNFSSGYQSNDGKGSARYVRPVRAF